VSFLFRVSRLKPLKIPIKAIVILIVATFLIYLAVGLFAGFEDVLDAISLISMQTYLWVIVLTFGNWFIKSVRWYFFLNNYNSTVGMKRHLVIYIAGLSLTALPGKAGEMIRSVYLKPFNINYVTSIGAFFSEKLLDVFIVMILAVFALNLVIDINGVFYLVLLLLPASIIVGRSDYVGNIFNRLAKRKLGALAQDFQSHVSVFLSNKSLLTAIPLSLMSWCLCGVILFVILKDLGFEFSIYILIGIYCMSVLAGAISLLPGGVGATEGTMIFLLGTLGVDVASAAAVALIAHLFILWLATVLGFTALTVVNISKEFQPIDI
jgi:uncharacterized protein (TIRG00374 family)